MASFELSPIADADLAEIFEYTAQQWGAHQAHKYLLELEACAEALGSDNGHFKNLDALRKGLRVARSGHHYVYCILRNGKPALIVAVLHERMDLMTRIAARLK